MNDRRVSMTGIEWPEGEHWTAAYGVKNHALLAMRLANIPTALRFMLFAAMRKDTLRPASRYASDMSNRGSRNYWGDVCAIGRQR